MGKTAEKIERKTSSRTLQQNAAATREALEHQDANKKKADRERLYEEIKKDLWANKGKIRKAHALIVGTDQLDSDAEAPVAEEPCFSQHYRWLHKVTPTFLFDTLLPAILGQEKMKVVTKWKAQEPAVLTELFHYLCVTKPNHRMIPQTLHSTFVKTYVDRASERGLVDELPMEGLPDWSTVGLYRLLSTENYEEEFDEDNDVKAHFVGCLGLVASLGDLQGAFTVSRPIRNNWCYSLACVQLTGGTIKLKKFFKDNVDFKALTGPVVPNKGEVESDSSVEARRPSKRGATSKGGSVEGGGKAAKLGSSPASASSPSAPTPPPPEASERDLSIQASIKRRNRA